MTISNTIREINRGGFGVIEEVVCNDGHHYAKKTFSPISDPRITPELIEKFRNRFIREVETQRRLPHEYVIPIIGYNLTDSSPWYLMPIAEYDYNHEIESCKREYRKPEGLSDILNALEYLHNLGLVHRDLKPGNILFHDGKWKLSDLGLITHDKEIVSLSITSSNGLGYGSAPYAAPEQTTGFKHVDNRADIYSFGAILHDIFGNSPRTPYSNLSCPGDMNVILDKCTKKDPKQRFKNVESLRNRLLYILSKDDTQPITATLQHQISKFTNLDTFDYAQLEDLVFYLKDENSDLTNLFYELNNEIINHIYTVDKELFIEFSLIYIEWVKSTNFVFDYCDVIIGLINNIYSKTNDIDLKAKCVIAAAELGRSHNRWFVMENVVKMANDNIEERLALRLQIDIDIETRNKHNFNRCVEGINRTKNSYHSLIAEIL